MTSKFLMAITDTNQHDQVRELALRETKRRRTRVTIAQLYEEAMRKFLRGVKRCSR